MTLQTIADALGVSRTTVSNAYNRPNQLNPELRRKVLETAAELGIAGLAALSLLVAGVGIGVVRLHRLSPGAGAAAAGGLAAWSVHAMLDWAWEMPSVTLTALLLAAAAIAAGEERQGDAEGRHRAEPTATAAAIA